MFLSDGAVISISLQVEFTESSITISGPFTVRVQSVLTGMSHMMVMLLSFDCASQSLAQVGTICLQSRYHDLYNGRHAAPLPLSLRNINYRVLFGKPRTIISCGFYCSFSSF